MVGWKSYRRLLFTVTLLCLVSASASLARGPRAKGPRPLTVYLKAAGEDVSVKALSVHASSVSDLSGAEGESSAEASASADGVVVLQLAPHRIWQLKVDSESVWSPTKSVLSTGAGETVSLPVFRRSQLSGTLEVPEGDQEPEVLRLRFGSPLGHGDIPESRATCPVESAEFHCVVPAARLDVRLKAKGFTPRYVWDLVVEPDASTKLGVVRLRHGAALAGRVVGPDGRPESGVEVSAVVQQAGLASTPGAARVGEMPMRATTNSRGFFLIGGIAPGTYTLTALDSEGNRADLLGLNLTRGVDVELANPLELHAPIRFELSLTPPVPPTDGRWGVSLAKQDVPGHMAMIGPLDEDSPGHFVKAGLSSGLYYVRVADSMGASFLFRPVSLPEDNPLDVRLPLASVTGTVTLGRDRPLEAVVIFGGRTGGVQVRMSTDSKGHYAGVLPHPGNWRVDVTAREPDVTARIDGVEVRKRKDGRAVRVDLAVPDTLVRGRVVDSRGRMIRRATVAIATPGGQFMGPYRPDQDGSFEIRGVPEGSVRIFAEGVLENGRSASSAEVPVIVSEEGSAPSDVRLIVRGRRHVSGRVIFPGGDPAVGALVEAAPLRGGHSSGAMVEHTITDPNGEFSLDLPAGTDELLALYGASGGALREQVLNVPEEFDGARPLVLVAERLGGTLTFVLPDSLDNGSPDAGQLVVFQSGLPIGIGSLLDWARAHGEKISDPRRLQIPFMAAAGYAACLLTPTEFQQLRESPLSFALSGDCSTGTLVPGGTLSLTLN